MMPLPTSPSASSTSSMTPPPVTMAPSLGRSPAHPPPTNARGTPRRPPKLRSSCDACGAAKVRCDKTQPRCGRCVTGGLNCVYGLSRKFGKAPRKKPPVDTSVAGETLPRPLAQSHHHHHHQQQQQQQNIVNSSSNSSNSIACCPPPADYRHLSGAARPIKYEPTPVSSYGLDDSLMAMTGAYHPSHDLFLRSPHAMDTTAFEDHFSFSDPPTSGLVVPDPRGTVDPLDLTFPSSSDFQSFAEWVHPDDLMHTPESCQDADAAPSLTASSRTASLDSMHGIPDALATSTSSATTGDAHNCSKLAYATLEGLSFRQEQTTTHGERAEPPTQTMDKVLNRNKQAVASMHALLECPCSKSPHLAMLYASITSKILMWYQLAAGCTKPTTTWDCFSSSLPSSSSSFFPSSTSPLFGGFGGFGGSGMGPSSHHHQPTPPLSASSSPSMAFVQLGSPIARPTSNSNNNNNNNSSSSSNNHQFIVTPMQFSVGAFSVDDESAQEALRKQLLLSELKKAGNLIDLLSVHGRDELATAEVNDIYSALGTWLKCELNRTIASLKS